jgi:hypothetical protein
VSIYLPDELGDQVKAELGDANISAICQAALRAELDRASARKAAAAKLDEAGFERVEAFDTRGDDEHDVAFQGKQIGSDFQRGDVAYLTARGSIAVVGDGHASNDELLGIYGSYQEFAEYGYSWGLVSDVAHSLGEEAPVEELDI